MKRRTLLQAASLMPLLGGRALAQGTGNPRGALSAKVAMHQGRATLFLNDQPVYPMIYALTDTPGGRWTWEEIDRENLENFRDAGVRLVQVDIWLEYIWRADGSMDHELVRRQLRGALEVDPNAALSIRVHVNAPAWWNAAHPEEITQFADGPVTEMPVRGLHRLLEHDLDRVPRASMASLKWREDAGRALREMLQALADTPEGKRVYAIHPACGVYHEWHYWGFIDHDPDTGAAMTRFFRRWLREKYGDDAKLAAAWAQPGATIDKAEVPGTAQRRIVDGLFRDPQKKRQVSDYYECQQLTVADSIIHFCRTAKESWPRPLVTGVFYGYFFVLFGRPQTGGHLQLQRVLNSPWVDYLSAPQAYGAPFRGIGGSGQPRGLPESLRLHGKLLLDEMDTEPPVYKKIDPVSGKTDKALLSDSVAILRRNVAQTYCQGHGLWFYDFGPGRDAHGWWDDAVQMGEIAKMRDLFGRYYQRPHVPVADVAVVYDTDSFYYTAAYADQDPVIGPQLVNLLPTHLYRSGAAIDILHLGDIERADWQRYKCVIFANTFLLTDAQRDFIQRHVAQGGRHVVWMMAPGYVDGAKLDTRGVSSVTGIALERQVLAAPPRAKLAWPGGQCDLELAKTFDPFFVVKDSAAKAFGTMDDGSVVAARKKLSGHTAWYFSLPPLDDALLGHVARESGAHMYVPPGDVVHAGGGILCLHSPNGGPRQVMLRSGKQLNLTLPSRSTSLYDAASGEPLLV